MSHLKLVSSRPKPVIHQIQPMATLHAGCRYPVSIQNASVLNTTHGVVGEYQIGSSHARIIPVPAETSIDQNCVCCFWDTDVDLFRLETSILNEATGQSIPLQDCALKSNRLIMNSQSMDAPQLLYEGGDATLMMSPRFDFTLSTDSYTAQIGVIHLVQASRFITLHNGTVINILNTHDKEVPVLYLENQQDEQPVKLVLAQQEIGVTREHSYACTVSQHIPEKFEGEAVATVTVLEQYQSYFMQRAIPFDDHLNMWIPIHAPILWGWSIRVGRRGDEEWGILKRKQILPTTGHDGMQLPEWNDNTINCSNLP